MPVVLPWYSTGDEPTDAAVVAAVQGDVPGNGDDILLDHRQVTRNHIEATIDLADRVASGEVEQPDIVVWPENSTAVDPFEDGETNAGIVAASTAIGVPLLVGAIVDAGEDHVLNQGIVWDPVTGAGDRYTKWHPVAYGEYIPFRRFFDGKNFGRLALIPRDMLSGSREEPLNVAGVPVADAICFDVAYDDGIAAQLTNGAELFVVQTSNATFINTDQTDQQFAITRMRAIETGRWAVVASTNGVTGVIAPDGTRGRPGRADARATCCSRRSGCSTRSRPAMRLGPWPARVCVGLTVLGLVLVLRRGAGPPRPTTHPATEPAGEPEPVGVADMTDLGRVVMVVPDLQRGGEPRLGGRSAARRAARRWTCSSSTTAHPTAPAGSPTSWPRPTPPSTCCTGPRRRGSGRRTSPGSAGRSTPGTTSSGRWTPTARTSPSSCTCCSTRWPTPTW